MLEYRGNLAETGLFEGFSQVWAFESQSFWHAKAMCGIAGTVNWGDAESVEQMCQLQAHRGPDDSGIWQHTSPDGTRVCLGSRRLAIVDLSKNGHMPMSNSDGTIWITYNGEVYNFLSLREELKLDGYRFRSRTDTEVILRLYEREGEECVHRLRGMFAFGICDLRSGRPKIFLARGHFGIKPLYYTQKGDRLAFASEAKALFVLEGNEARLNNNALARHLTFLWVPEPDTLFEGVEKLPAGHCATFQDGQFSIKKFWELSMPDRKTRYTRSEEDLAEEVRHRLSESVREQMISDVPLGSFLSAGIDSASLVAMAAETTNHPLKTYTISFPARHRVGENTLDDPSVASRVAHHFGCDHHQIVVEPDVASLISKLVWHMDEPIADPAIVMAYLVCREARKDVTVLLSGIGGDELFAGYRKHVAATWSRMYRNLPALFRNHFLSPAIHALPVMRGTRWKGMVRLAKKMVRSASLPPEDAFLMNSTYLDSAEQETLLSREYRELRTPEDTWAVHRGRFREVANADFLNQMLYVDTSIFMPSLNLNYMDKMSMACSVEARVPFLDVRMAEFVATQVPPGMKLRGFLKPKTKYILRRAMEKSLPAEVFRQPKAGFFAPVDYWLSQDLREMVGDILSPERIRARGIFDPDAVWKMIEQQRAGDQDWSMQIWQLLIFEIWAEAYLKKSVAVPVA